MFWSSSLVERRLPISKRARTASETWHSRRHPLVVSPIDALAWRYGPELGQYAYPHAPRPGLSKYEPRHRGAMTFGQVQDTVVSRFSVGQCCVATNPAKLLSLPPFPFPLDLPSPRHPAETVRSRHCRPSRLRRSSMLDHRPILRFASEAPATRIGPSAKLPRIPDAGEASCPRCPASPPNSIRPSRGRTRPSRQPPDTTTPYAGTFQRRRRVFPRYYRRAPLSFGGGSLIGYRG